MNWLGAQVFATPDERAYVMRQIVGLVWFQLGALRLAGCADLFDHFARRFALVVEREHNERGASLIAQILHPFAQPGPPAPGYARDRVSEVRLLVERFESLAWSGRWLPLRCALDPKHGLPVVEVEGAPRSSVTLVSLDEKGRIFDAVTAVNIKLEGPS